jgi:hypothetical protein
MTTAQIKAQKTAQTYEAYLSSCDKIKNSKNFSLKTLQRVLRPTCKTLLLNDSVLTFKLKNSKTGVSVILSPEIINLGTRYLTVRTSKNSSLEYLLSATTVKELMLKINYTYKLLAN